MATPHVCFTTKADTEARSIVRVYPSHRLKVAIYDVKYQLPLINVGVETCSVIGNPLEICRCWFLPHPNTRPMMSRARPDVRRSLLQCKSATETCRMYSLFGNLIGLNSLTWRCSVRVITIGELVDPMAHTPSQLLTIVQLLAQCIFLLTKFYSRGLIVFGPFTSTQVE
jgi:hypothetical protein